MYNTLIIIQHASDMNKFFYRKHKMTHFSCCCNANMYSRMADKLPKGSNFDSGVIGMQGNAAETRKTAI